MEYDYLFKIIIIGDSGIGKYAIFFRFFYDGYNENYNEVIFRLFVLISKLYILIYFFDLIAKFNID